MLDKALIMILGIMGLCLGILVGSYTNTNKTEELLSLKQINFNGEDSLNFKHLKGRGFDCIIVSANTDNAQPEMECR